MASSSCVSAMLCVLSLLSVQILAAPASTVAPATAAPATEPAAAEVPVNARNPNLRVAPILPGYFQLLYSPIYSYCFPSGQATISVSYGAVDTCAQACLVRDDCAFFSYNAATQGCELKHAVSGYAFASRKVWDGNCYTYYKRYSMPITPNAVAQGRSIYVNMGTAAMYDVASTICRNRGLHMPEIRNANERNAALSTSPAGYWMNFYPSAVVTSSNFRYRDDAALLSTFVASIAPKGYHSANQLKTAYCALMLDNAYYYAYECTTLVNVLCQYSDLDRF